MKRTCRCAGAMAAMALAFSSQDAQATIYYATGTVAKIFSVDRTNIGPHDSFLISGFTSAGTCPTNDGLISLSLRDDEGGRRQLALLLAAKMSGAEVSIRVNDSFKNPNGVCYLLLLEIP